MNGPKFTISASGWIDGLDGAPDRMAQARDDATLAWMLGFIDRLQTERLNGDPIHRRTGELANEWTPQIISYPDHTSFSVKSMAGLQDGLGYAIPLEYGADIVPKTSKYLWVPVADNLTGAGVQRMSPTDAINAGGYYTPSKDGLGKLFFSLDADLLFALRPEVVIEPMMGGNDLWEEESATLGPAIRDAMMGAIRAK